MALDFPNTPTPAQIYAGPSGLYWVWDGVKWLAGASSGVSAGGSSSMIKVTAAATLPAGFRGFVRVENSTSAPIMLGMPASPSAGQEVTVKDCLGNAGIYPVTIGGNGATIEGQASLTLQYDYSWVDLMFTGSQWVQA